MCVFPSVWENFPYVCLEAMAAGRGVIASSGGGMAEIIDDGRTGRLVEPRDPRGLADAMLEMLADPAGRIAMGKKARAHIGVAYSSKVIGPLQEASYSARSSGPALGAFRGRPDDALPFSRPMRAQSAAGRAGGNLRRPSAPAAAR